MLSNIYQYFMCFKTGLEKDKATLPVYCYRIAYKKGAAQAIFNGTRRQVGLFAAMMFVGVFGHLDLLIR